LEYIPRSRSAGLQGQSVIGKVNAALLYLSPVSGERRVQARQDNVVKVTAKFIRKGTHFQQTEVGSFLE
jgi:hypothetical protein